MTRVNEPEKVSFPSDLTESERDEYEERAAIMEHDGGASTDVAEAEALRLVLSKRKGQRVLW